MKLALLWHGLVRFVFVLFLFLLVALVVRIVLAVVVALSRVPGVLCYVCVYVCIYAAAKLVKMFGPLFASFPDAIMATRFVDYPQKGFDWVKHSDGTVQNARSYRKIRCAICKQPIKVENEMEREFIRADGRPATSRCEQPLVVYRCRRFIMQHVNCTPDSFFQAEYTDDE